MSWSIALIVAEWTLRLLMPPVVLLRQKRPSVALAWMAAIFFIPWLGTLAYVLLGEIRLGRRRIKRYARDTHLFITALRPAHQQLRILGPELRTGQRSIATLAERLGALPPIGGNDIDIISDPASFVDRLEHDIDAARRSVNLMYFIFEPDEVGGRIAEALKRAASRGVDCRLLADSAGSWNLFGDFSSSLTEAGVHVAENMPVQSLRRIFSRVDLRNHRKLAVIDGVVAYTGSQNIVTFSMGHRKAGHWQDLSLRICGPAVTQLQAVFVEDWQIETGQDLHGPEHFPDPGEPGRAPVQVVASGPTQAEPVIRDVFVEALNSARRHAIITTPYFIPDEPLHAAIRLAAARGVQVDLVVPHRSDKRICDLAAHSLFSSLLSSGINIYQHRRGLLHAKTMSVDDGFAFVGSANFDIRSFFLNFELSVLLYDADAVARLRYHQARYIAESHKLDPAAWANRPRVLALAESAAGLFSPLL